jgi:3-phytase
MNYDNKFINAVRYCLAAVILLLQVTLLSSCEKGETSSEKTGIKEGIEIKETYLTTRDTVHNVDSPVIWHGPGGEHWIITTAKETNVLLVYNAADGSFVKQVGSGGNKPGQFRRPNGISVIDNLLFIVERDNQRVQVMKLPGFEFLGFIGNGLIKPYGLYIRTDSISSYSLYVTDNYETADEQVPPQGELGRRVHLYNVKLENNKVISSFVKAFGDTSGAGVLRVVESVYGDSENDNLLVAEEDEADTYVKVYDMNGNFKNKTIGRGLFKFQVEGISLFSCGNGKGFWIITDQSMTDNLFHFFDRKTFNHLGSFKGSITKNTDGIWLSAVPFGSFPAGIFAAVHDDGNIAVFNFAGIVDSLNLQDYCNRE